MATSRKNQQIRARGSKFSVPLGLDTYLDRNNPASVALTFVPQVPGYLPPPRIEPPVDPRFDLLINTADQLMINNTDSFLL